MCRLRFIYIYIYVRLKFNTTAIIVFDLRQHNFETRAIISPEHDQLFSENDDLSVCKHEK